MKYDMGIDKATEPGQIWPMITTNVGGEAGKTELMYIRK